MSDDKNDSVSSREAKFVADVERMLQDTEFVNSVRRYEAAKLRGKLELEKQALRDRRRWYWRGAAFTALVVLVVIATVIITVRAPKSGTTTAISPAPTNPFIWDDQFTLPVAMPGFDPKLINTSDYIDKVVTQQFGDFMRSSIPRLPVQVPQNQRVILIARLQHPDWSLYDASGQFTETCTIEAGGTLMVIGEDFKRKLVAYQRPPLTMGATPAKGMCGGDDEVFFEQTG